MGSLDGVLITNSAWIDKREVVEVTYRPSEVSYATLVKHAVQHSCDQMIFTQSDAQAKVAREIVGATKVTPYPGQVRQGKDSDQLYYLRNSSYRWVPLTPLQARRVNSALFFKQDPKQWMSPRQIQLAKRIDAGLKDETIAKHLKGLVRPPTVEGLIRYSQALETALSTNNSD